LSFALLVVSYILIDRAARRSVQLMATSGEDSLEK
jgi:hypothetical protein